MISCITLLFVLIILTFVIYSIHTLQGFPKIRKAVMTVQYGGKTKEAKLKDLYDDIAANEKEWLTFLNHPYNIEFVFECVAMCHEYAKIQYDTHKDRDTCLEVLILKRSYWIFYKSCQLISTSIKRVHLVILNMNTVTLFSRKA